MSELKQKDHWIDRMIRDSEIVYNTLKEAISIEDDATFALFYNDGDMACGFAKGGDVQPFLRDGFRGTTGQCMTPREFRGVFLLNESLLKLMDTTAIAVLVRENYRTNGRVPPPEVVEAAVAYRTPPETADDFCRLIEKTQAK